MKVKPVEVGTVARLNPVQRIKPAKAPGTRPPKENARPTAPMTIATPKEPQKEAQADLERELERSTRQMNAISEILGQRYQFSVDKTTDQLVVKVIDVFTGEIIRQMPPEEMLKLAAQMRHIVGMFMDQLV